MLPITYPNSPNPLKPLSPFGYFLLKEKEIGNGVFGKGEIVRIKSGTLSFV